MQKKDVEIYSLVPTQTWSLQCLLTGEFSKLTSPEVLNWSVQLNLLACVFYLNQAPSPRSKPRHEGNSRSSHPNNSPPLYKLHSFSLLNYDRERLERKVFLCVLLDVSLFMTSTSLKLG